MTHPNFGTKYTCHACAAKFYDMKKAEPKCPKCAADPKDDPALKASEKSSKKGQRDGAEPEEFDEEAPDTDMDELAHDDDAEEEGEGEVDELGGNDDEP